ncbi:hypothetical protein TorRG33x02_276370 [Trema orientale]|uniref:RNase H type-1 domain-containing protein n=1 Tax=Trema orientale TaxID=63057 RepID=A0A2P5CQV8_TREOI|nr:hypothetical protein TorRG33x02_276370 [Trema orientale]
MNAYYGITTNVESSRSKAGIKLPNARSTPLSYSNLSTWWRCLWRLKAQTKNREFQSHLTASKPPPPSTQTRWQPPSDPWIKLNVDAAITEVGTCIEVSGLIRNHLGEVLISFCSNTKTTCTIEVVEAFNLRHGISCAKDADLGPVLMESNAYNVVSLVNNKTVTSADIGVIIKDVQNLLVSIPGSSVCFVPRSCNSAAHMLVKWSVANNGTFSWQGETPHWLLSSNVF